MKNWNFCVHFPANFFNMCFKREWIVDNYTKELDLWNVIQFIAVNNKGRW